MKLFFIVLAKDGRFVEEKVTRLKNINVPYVVVCGEKLNLPHVVYRKPVGKYDAINFGIRFIPKDVDIIIFNDVDTKIYRFNAALACLEREKADLVFTKVVIREGPQILFNLFLDAIRRWILITANGELILIRHEVLDEVLPLKSCKAEDTYILFKILELGYKAIFCEECFVETERTKSIEKEEMYKRKTVAGIYQALSYTKPPRDIRLFYILLPLISPLLLFLGRKGHYWIKGILHGLLDYLRGDRSGFWQTTYME